MMRTNLKLFALITLVIALSACGRFEGGQMTFPGAISVTLTPSAAGVHVNQSVQFAATGNGTFSDVVTWSLSGAGCIGATCGTISSTGLYTAPASVPSPATVTVKATSAIDTTKSASARITILEGVNEWTWVSGSNTIWPAGIYGTKGTADSANVPGARDGAVSWIDSSGNLWLFGGEGCDSSGFPPGLLNDLWKYDPTTNEWTWVSGSNTAGQAGIYGTKGTPDSSNVPGSREQAVSWIDSSGNLWLFGGGGIDGDLNDLWKYDLTTLKWTWVSGSNTFVQAQMAVYGTRGIADPSNVPGARIRPVSWIDLSGNLWLFGGFGWVSSGSSSANYGWLNDLWKFDPTTLEWTWVSGTSITNQPGVYGSRGVAAPSNVPGARREALSWSDSNGKLWLFGGADFHYDSLNDLWEFDPTTLEWTWVSGSNTPNQVGRYGTQGIAASFYVPGARAAAVSWVDSSGNFWLFGGHGVDPTGYYGWLNDLWKFDPTTLEWTWVSGTSIVDQAGIYGTKGIAVSLNAPGARTGAVTWLDSSGRLWLFGGNGFDLAGNFGYLNDLWQYIR